MGITTVLLILYRLSSTRCSSFLTSALTILVIVIFCIILTVLTFLFFLLYLLIPPGEHAKSRFVNGTLKIEYLPIKRSAVYINLNILLICRAPSLLVLQLRQLPPLMKCWDFETIDPLPWVVLWAKSPRIFRGKRET